VYAFDELVRKARRFCLCSIVGLVLLVRRLNSDNLGAFCLDSLAGKVLVQCLLDLLVCNQQRRPTQPSIPPG